MVDVPSVTDGEGFSIMWTPDKLIPSKGAVERRLIRSEIPADWEEFLEVISEDLQARQSAGRAVGEHGWDVASSQPSNGSRLYTETVRTSAGGRPRFTRRNYFEIDDGKKRFGQRTEAEFMFESRQRTASEHQ